jgi:hypothetical protein
MLEQQDGLLVLWMTFLNEHILRLGLAIRRSKFVPDYLAAAGWL